ncbi:MAG: hypothetical protein JXA94_04605 [Parachlamydiales bacterium]|nr:hypothetical protein [Parachlamydiales bacterium]
MKKEKLISFLEKAIITEETATTIYLQHYDAFSSRFDVDEKYKKEAKKIIKVLIAGNRKHKKICEMILNKIKRSKKHDY